MESETGACVAVRGTYDLLIAFVACGRMRASCVCSCGNGGLGPISTWLAIELPNGGFILQDVGRYVFLHEVRRSSDSVSEWDCVD